MARSVESYTPYVALAAAVIAFVAAVISILETLEVGRKLITVSATVRSVDEEIQDVKQQVEDIFSCWGEAEIDVRQPLAEDRVSAKIIAWGEASVDPRCRYVYVFVHDLSTVGANWRVTDVTQTDREGRWSGIASLDHVSVGGQAEIHVRLTSRPVYKPIPAFLEHPPPEGVPSQTIRVRRIE